MEYEQRYESYLVAPGAWKLLSVPYDTFLWRKWCDVLPSVNEDSIYGEHPDVPDHQIYYEIDDDNDDDYEYFSLCGSTQVFRYGVPFPPSYNGGECTRDLWANCSFSPYRVFEGAGILGNKNPSCDYMGNDIERYTDYEDSYPNSIGYCECKGGENGFVETCAAEEEQMRIVVEVTKAKKNSEKGAGEVDSEAIMKFVLMKSGGDDKPGFVYFTGELDAV